MKGTGIILIALIAVACSSAPKPVQKVSDWTADQINQKW